MEEVLKVFEGSVSVLTITRVQSKWRREQAALERFESKRASMQSRTRRRMITRQILDLHEKLSKPPVP